MYCSNLLRLLSAAWKISWSGLLRLVVGTDWLERSQNLGGVEKLRNCLRDHVFFSAKDITDCISQVWLPDGVLILPSDSIVGVFEIYVLDVYDVLHKIRDDDVVVDVGAHAGIFTLKAARSAKNGHVVAIEPNERNFKMLVKNIELNNIKNVTPLNIALSDSDDWRKLYVSRSSGRHTLTPKKSMEKRPDKYVWVRTRTLDSIISELGIGKIDLIKVDVEGGEFEVLTGSVNVLSGKDGLRVSVASYHYPDEAREMIKFLLSRGFEVSWNYYFDGLSPYVYGVKPKF